MEKPLITIIILLGISLILLGIVLIINHFKTDKNKPTCSGLMEAAWEGRRKHKKIYR